jgi:hypothetical protein
MPLCDLLKSKVLTLKNIYDDEEIYFFPFSVPHVFTGNMSGQHVIHVC